MPRTRDFRQTSAQRVQRDPAYAKALLVEAATLLLNGEAELAERVLRQLAEVIEPAQFPNGTKGGSGLPLEVSDSRHLCMNQLSATFRAVSSSLGVTLVASSVTVPSSA